MNAQLTSGGTQCHADYQAWRAADEAAHPEEYETSLDQLLREVTRPYREARNLIERNWRVAPLEVVEKEVVEK